MCVAAVIMRLSLTASAAVYQRFVYLLTYLLTYVLTYDVCAGRSDRDQYSLGVQS